MGKSIMSYDNPKERIGQLWIKNGNLHLIFCSENSCANTQTTFYKSFNLEHENPDSRITWLCENDSECWESIDGIVRFL